jgi:hypothetical protein
VKFPRRTIRFLPSYYVKELMATKAKMETASLYGRIAACKVAWCYLKYICIYNNNEGSQLSCNTTKKWNTRDDYRASDAPKIDGGHG